MDLKDKIKYERNGIKFPCEMLVWDANESACCRRIVVCHTQGSNYPFKTIDPFTGSPCQFKNAKPLPKPTWREALKEKLKDHPEHFELICERSPDECLDDEFADWSGWSEYGPNSDHGPVSFEWVNAPEGFQFWEGVYHYLNSYRDDLPPIPKPKKKRLMTPEELKGKWLRSWNDDGHLYLVTAIDPCAVFLSGWSNSLEGCWINIQDLGSDGFRLENGDSLEIEVEEGEK